MSKLIKKMFKINKNYNKCKQKIKIIINANKK